MPAPTPQPAPAPEPEPAPAPETAPANATVPAAVMTRTQTGTAQPQAKPLHDLTRCERPTRAYPRWCDEIKKQRVTPKAEGAASRGGQ